MTGAVIALLVKEPALAVPLSFLSHFVCDAIPHFGLAPGEKLFERKFNFILSSDFITALCTMVILGMLFPAQSWLIWSCMVAAASPDLMWAYYNLYIEKLQKKKPRFGLLARFHIWIQWSQTPKGWFVEGAWFLATIAVILAQR